MRRVTIPEMQALIGQEFGVSDWFKVSQERINQFADATLDHQFIHVDEDKAKETPFGETVAHGFLTLSLLSKFVVDIGLKIEGSTMGINYGFEKIRFLAPVRANARIRARFTLQSVSEKKAGQYLLSYGVIVDIAGEETPALIANWLGMQVT